MSLIRTNLRISRLTLGWNEFRKVPYVSEELSTQTSWVQIRKEEFQWQVADVEIRLEGEQMGGEFTEDKNFYKGC